MTEIRVSAAAFEEVRVRQFVEFLSDTGKMEKSTVRGIVEAILTEKLLEIRDLYVETAKAHVEVIGKLRTELRAKYDAVLERFQQRAGGAAGELPADLRPEAFQELFGRLESELEALQRQGEPEAFGEGLNEAELGERLLGDETAGQYPREALEVSPSSLTSLETARAAGIPDLLIADGTVLTRADFPGVLPDAPSPASTFAPEPLATTQQVLAGERIVGLSDVQNREVMADARLLVEAGQQPGAELRTIRVNQMQVIEDIRVGTNRPDLYAELNGRRVHIEYDRAPGTRAMAHAQRILTNDPEAIVILKIVDF